MKKNVLLGLTVLIVFMAGCKKKSDNGSTTTVPPIWAVGLHQNTSTDPGPVVLHTTDGTTWQRLTNDLFGTGSIYGVYALTDKNVWMVSSTKLDEKRILHTLDGGLTWRNELAGTNLIHDILVSIYAFDQQHAWACGLSGNILLTTNGGTTWDTANTAIFDHKYNYYKIQSADGINVWAVGECTDTLHPDTTHLFVFHSGDGGVNWEKKQITGKFPGLPGLYGLSVLDSKTIFVSGIYSSSSDSVFGIVYVSSDSGSNWQCIGNLGSNAAISDVQALSRQNIWALSKINQSIYHTLDGGATWNTLYINSNGPAVDLNQIIGLDNTNAWVVGSSKLDQFEGIMLRTTDGNQMNEVSLPVNACLWGLSIVGSR